MEYQKSGKAAKRKELSEMYRLMISLPPDSEDLNFHQCAKLSRFDQEGYNLLKKLILLDRIISFIPPDGDWTLLEYKLNSGLKCPFTIHTLVNIVDNKTLHVVIQV